MTFSLSPETEAAVHLITMTRDVPIAAGWRFLRQAPLGLALVAFLIATTGCNITRFRSTKIVPDDVEQGEMGAEVALFFEGVNVAQFSVSSRTRGVEVGLAPPNPTTIELNIAPDVEPKPFRLRVTVIPDDVGPGKPSSPFAQDIFEIETLPIYVHRKGQGPAPHIFAVDGAVMAGTNASIVVKGVNFDDSTALFIVEDTGIAVTNVSVRSP
ncbi:MAG: hypothetical protein ABI680_02530, partial [Chthoniobacteraceae bacterium]